MQEILKNNIMLSILFIVLVAVVFVFIAVRIIQYVGLDKIREVVYKGFITAESVFNSDEGQKKFDYVVHLARESLPTPFNMFITDKLLRKVIQEWFDLCKDLLDDGKFNNSEHDE